MKNKKKLIKIIAIMAAVLLFVSSISAVIALNFHKIFLKLEQNGVFCKEIKLVEVSLENTDAVTLEGLKRDGRVTFDQSLMLVNTLYTLQDDFVPEISEYKSTTVYMNDCMLDAYAKLSADISEKFNKKLYVSSDFRTAEDQQVLYEEDPLTATLPGASEHQSGLALDVYVARYAGDGFIKSPVGRFVNRNSWMYGFIIRYPSHAEDVTGIRFEPWHIRYVGHPHADVIYNNHITLEEYILGFEIGEWYEIDGYLVSRQKPTESGELTLPASFSACVISPDNTGCYIVTVEK